MGKNRRLLALVLAAATLPTLAYAKDLCSGTASDEARQRGVEIYLPGRPGDQEAHRPVMRVARKGRLQFYSVPNKNCKMDGTFIIPGDTVIGYTEFNGFTLVDYFRRNGDSIEGWVESDRLVWLK